MTKIVCLDQGEKQKRTYKQATTHGFGFTYYWFKKWREKFKPVKERSNAKLKQS